MYIGKNIFENIFNYFSSKNSDAKNSQSSCFYASARDLSNDFNINLISHRGYKDAPENTISAFDEAYQNGYDTFECDVSWSKDNEAVILHDSTINRTARKESGWPLFLRRKCSNLTYEELLKYDFGIAAGKKYKGEKIPTLDKTLDCVNENDGKIYIELKTTDEFDEQKAEILVDKVKEANLEDSVTWISFSEDYLAQINELLPDARLGYLYSQMPDYATLKTLQELNTDENEVFLDVKASEMTEESARMLDLADFSFEAWTVNDLETLDKMYSYGCKGFTTDELTNSEVYEFLSEKSDK